MRLLDWCGAENYLHVNVFFCSWSVSFNENARETAHARTLTLLDDVITIGFLSVRGVQHYSPTFRHQFAPNVSQIFVRHLWHFARVDLSVVMIIERHVTHVLANCVRTNMDSVVFDALIAIRQRDKERALNSPIFWTENSCQNHSIRTS